MKKELIEKYIKVKTLVSEKTEKLHEAFQGVHGDNYILSLIPDEYEDLLEDMLLECVGINGQDWVNWWLYDINQQPSMIWVNDVEIQINNFDDLWENVLQHE